MLTLIDPVRSSSASSLALYADDPRFATVVSDLRSEAKQVQPEVR